MKYVASLLMIQASGAEPTPDAILSLLASVGIDGDAAVAAQVIERCAGRSAEDILAAGAERMTTAEAVTADAAAAAAAAVDDDFDDVAEDGNASDDSDDSEPMFTLW